MGIPAEFMEGKSLDLKQNVVKVITCQSAKGLEFPVVVLAGLEGAWHVHDKTQEAQEEHEMKERRTYFVSMTRAMRALMVVLPEHSKSILFEGFDPKFWNRSS